MAEHKIGYDVYRIINTSLIVLMVLMSIVQMNDRFTGEQAKELISAVCQLHEQQQSQYCEDAAAGLKP